MKQENGVLDIWPSIRNHKPDVLLVGVSVLSGILFGWNIVQIAIFAFFIAVLLGHVSLRSVGLIALFFLSFTPVLLLLGRDAQAEEFSVYAYYFLVMAVIRGIIEIRKES